MSAQNQTISTLTQFDIQKAITFSKLFSKIKLKTSSRLVLRCLVDHHNTSKGYCFPKQSTLSLETGCSRETICNSIEELRAKGLLLTNGEKGDSLKYYLTQKFFDLLGISQGCEKNSQGVVEKTHNMNKDSFNKYNNKPLSNNSYHQKNKSKIYNKPINEPKYKSASQTIQTIENDKKHACSPLDFSKDKQIEYYNNLPAFLRINSLFAKEIKKRWGL